MAIGLQKNLLLLLGCLLMAGNAIAETLYVHDKIRLGVRAEASTSSNTLSVVTTGDALTVLDTNGKFTKVRTPKGVEGWVSSSYLNDEAPARTRLAALEEKHAALQQEQQILAQQLQARKDEVANLSQRLTMAEEKTMEQKVELDEYANKVDQEQHQWMIALALFLGCFIAGWYAGVRWKTRQVAERIGGLEI